MESEKSNQKTPEELNSTEKLKQYFRSVLGEQFNVKKFDQDIKDGKSPDYNDVMQYRIEKIEKDQLNNGQGKDGLHFTADFKDGMYRAIGSNGCEITSKNLDDFNRKLAKAFKVHAMTHNKEAQCYFRVGSNHLAEREKYTQAFARNFINEGVVVNGDLPRSKEFWSQFKTEYLAKEGHNPATWNRLTRFVPKEYLNGMEYQHGTQQPTKQEKQTNTSGMMIAKQKHGRE